MKEKVQLFLPSPNVADGSLPLLITMTHKKKFFPSKFTLNPLFLFHIYRLSSFISCQTQWLHLEDNHFVSVPLLNNALSLLLIYFNFSGEEVITSTFFSYPLIWNSSLWWQLECEWHLKWKKARRHRIRRKYVCFLHRFPLCLHSLKITFFARRSIILLLVFCVSAS